MSCIKCGGSSQIRNIETGEVYVEGYSTSFDSSEFLFISNRYDKDHSKRGVLKISKRSGEVELFK